MVEMFENSPEYIPLMNREIRSPLQNVERIEDQREEFKENQIDSLEDDSNL